MAAEELRKNHGLFDHFLERMDKWFRQHSHKVLTVMKKFDRHQEGLVSYDEFKSGRQSTFCTNFTGVQDGIIIIILEWTTSLDTSSRTLFVREDVHVTSNVELRNYVRLLLNVELRNYVISRQIVERRVT